MKGRSFSFGSRKKTDKQKRLMIFGRDKNTLKGKLVVRIHRSCLIKIFQNYSDNILDADSPCVSEAFHGSGIDEAGTTAEDDGTPVGPSVVRMWNVWVVSCLCW